MQTLRRNQVALEDDLQRLRDEDALRDDVLILQATQLADAQVRPPTRLPPQPPPFCKYPLNYSIHNVS